MKISKLVAALIMVTAVAGWATNANATYIYTATTDYGQDATTGLYLRNTLTFQTTTDCTLGTCVESDVSTTGFLDTFFQSTDGTTWIAQGSYTDSTFLSGLSLSSGSGGLVGSYTTLTVFDAGTTQYDLQALGPNSSSLNYAVTDYFGSGNPVGYQLDGTTAWVDQSTQPTTNVPEPASLALLGIGLVGMGVSRKRKA